MANGNDKVRMVKGVNSIDVPFVDKTVSEAFDEYLVTDYLNLNGGENFTITDSNGNEYEDYDENTPLNPGDTVSFTRKSGTKG